MTKKEFIHEYSKRIKEPKRKTVKYINDFLEIVEENLVKGDYVKFSGFGTFETKIRKGRIGTSPQTGEKLKINSKRTVRFRLNERITEEISNK